MQGEGATKASLREVLPGIQSILHHSVPPLCNLQCKGRMLVHLLRSKTSDDGAPRWPPEHGIRISTRAGCPGASYAAHGRCMQVVLFAVPGAFLPTCRCASAMRLVAPCQQVLCWQRYHRAYAAWQQCFIYSWGLSIDVRIAADQRAAAHCSMHGHSACHAASKSEGCTCCAA